MKEECIRVSEGMKEEVCMFVLSVAGVCSKHGEGGTTCVCLIWQM